MPQESLIYTHFAGLHGPCQPATLRHYMVDRRSYSSRESRIAMRRPGDAHPVGGHVVSRVLANVDKFIVKGLIFC